MRNVVAPSLMSLCNRTEYCRHLIKVIPQWIRSIELSTVDSSIHIYSNTEHVCFVLYFLRYNLNTQFKSFIDLCCIDYPSRAKRFSLVYQLLSFRYNTRVFVHICTSEVEAVPSST